MKKKGFTLTELLITLSIIGVIAILTIPNVAKNIYTKTYIAKLQSTIELLNNALNTMRIRERVSVWYDGSINMNTSKFFSDYIKVSGTCTTITECFSNSYKTIDGGSISSNDLQDISYAAILPSGAVVAYIWGGGFLIDVNGKEPPNVVGRDLFRVSILGNDGYLGADKADDMKELAEDGGCNDGSVLGEPCVYRLEMNDWELNY